MKDTVALDHGYKIYKQIRQKYGNSTPILVSPWKGTGDVYDLCLYMEYFLQKNNITKFLYIIIGKSEQSVLKLFPSITGYSTLIMTREDIDDLLKFASFVGYENANMFCLHHATPVKQTSLSGFFAGYQNLSMTSLTRNYILGLDPSLVKGDPSFSDEDVSVFFKNNGLIPGKTVIISPYSVSAQDCNIEFWEKIVEILKQKGYSICTNGNGITEPIIKGTIPIFFKYSEAKSYVEKAGYFIGLRNGLSDIISSLKCKKALVYPSNPMYCSSENVLTYTSLKTNFDVVDALELMYDPNDEETIQNKIISHITDEHGQHVREYECEKCYLSVIIPAHNAEKTIEATICSILSQKEVSEVVVVNDCSKDNTLSILHNICLKDSRVKVINSEYNRGAGLCRNLGIEYSSGYYVTFSDADDYVPENSYKKMIDIMNEQECDLVVGAYLIVYGNGKKLLNVPTRSETNYSAVMSSGAVWDKLFKRSILNDKKVRFPASNNFEDNVFLAKYFQKSKNIGVIDDVVYEYKFPVSSSGRLSQNYTSSVFKNALISMKILYSLQLSCTDEERFNAYIGSICWLIERWNNMDSHNQLESFSILKEIIFLYDWRGREFIFENLFGVSLFTFSKMNYNNYLFSHDCFITNSQNMMIERCKRRDVPFSFIIKCLIEWMRGKKR